MCLSLFASTSFSQCILFVEPLLLQIKPENEEFAEARRLSEFLLNFLPVPPNAIPRNSILREYIGGSSFSY